MVDGSPVAGLSASGNQFPPAQPYHPTTFQERGVAVPFTTPLLGGTRARRADKRGLELVIPNFTGGRGVYIVPWSNIAGFCRPTLHDKILISRIAELKTVTPTTIRRVGREIAAEGLAGEAAMRAARSATDAEQEERLVTNYQLLISLIEQANVAPAAGPGATASPALEMERRAKITTAWTATQLDRSTIWVATALESLTDVMRNFGLGSARNAGRIPQLVGMLRKVSAEISEWSTTRAQPDQAADARMVCSVADFTLEVADEMLERTCALVKDMIGLLRDWSADSASLVRIVARPEWLLDGWEQVCLIWNHAQDASGRRAALVEIFGLVPIPPKEVYEWCDVKLHPEAGSRFQRLVGINEDWRTGATIFSLIARNEHFRAASWLAAAEGGPVSDSRLARTP
jgi:hypothetical protein